MREALNRLETEGLIRIEPRRGAYLRGFEIKDIDELYDLREALETHVVHTAVIDAGVLGELRESIRRMREYLKDNDKRRYIDEDIHFHSTLAEASGNERLSKMLENVQQQIWLFRRKTYDLSSSSAPDAHEAILTALENGKRMQAERAMSEHIASVRQKLVDFLAQESARRKATSNGK